MKTSGRSQPGNQTWISWGLKRGTDAFEKHKHGSDVVNNKRKSLAMRSRRNS
jgi:hypothetical protein